MENKIHELFFLLQREQAIRQDKINTRYKIQTLQNKCKKLMQTKHSQTVKEGTPIA